MIDRYAAKLNKVEGKIYVVEETVNTVGGVYENELDHDNAEVGTINVYTGSKLTGTKVDNVIISVPIDAPWKRRVRILSSAETLYISYETPGDTVEADDINRVQDGIVRTQEALQEHRDSTQVALNGKVDKVSGKGLSTNDYTAADKGKLAGISARAQVNTVTSVAGKTGAISLAKGDVGLGNVDNTPDANKPISAATQAALDGKVGSARVLTDVPLNAKFTDTVYVHPATAGNKHIPTGGASGQILRYSADGTAILGSDNDTITTINGKTGAISKADITALGIPAQDTVVDISGKADKTYVDNKVKTDVPTGAKFTDTITTINGKTGTITKADITALGIPAQDTVYTHPASHPPSIITQDASNRFVTDTEKATWNAKASTSVATTSANGLMSSTDKSKLDGVATGANKYTHPSTHPASIITEDTSHRFVSDSEKGVWNGKQDALGFTPVNTTDSRLSDARTPLTHTHAESEITNLVTDLAGKEPIISTKLTAFNKNYNTSTTNVKMDGTVSVGTQDLIARADHIHPKDTTKANLASPTFTGTPTAPTATAGTNTTQLATTAFVQGAMSSAGLGDMLKGVYDKNNNGIVDNAEKVNGFTVGVNVPSDARFTDTIYTHPASHPASMITGLPASLPASGGNADTVNGKTVAENVPLGAKFTDTVYSHPATHPPSIIAQNATNRFVSDSEKANWNSKETAGAKTWNDLKGV